MRANLLAEVENIAAEEDLGMPLNLRGSFCRFGCSEVHSGVF